MGCSVHRTLLPFPLSLKPLGTCHSASTGSPPLPAALSPGSHTGSSESPWPLGPAQDSNAARPHHPPGGPPLPHLPVQARHLPGHPAQSLGRRHRRCWNPPGGIRCLPAASPHMLLPQSSASDQLLSKPRPSLLLNGSSGHPDPTLGSPSRRNTPALEARQGPRPPACHPGSLVHPQTDGPTGRHPIPVVPCLALSGQRAHWPLEAVRPLLSLGCCVLSTQCRAQSRCPIGIMGLAGSEFSMGPGSEFSTEPGSEFITGPGSESSTGPGSGLSM